MGKSWHKALRRCTAHTIPVYSRLTRLVPLRVARFSGSILGTIAYCAVPGLRRVGRANIIRVYGESLPLRQQRRTVLNSVKSAGIVASEFSRISQLHTEKYRKLISANGIEHIDPSKGGLIVSAHLGNWEWLAPALIQQGVPMSIVVNQFPDNTVNTYIDSVRLSGGVTTIPRNEAASSIVQRIRRGEFVGMLIDQRTHRTGVPVDFLGTKCWTTQGPALIAIRARAPVYVVSLCRCCNGEYDLSVLRPILMERSGDLRRDVRSLSQRLQDGISSLIREHPDQWLWGYNRWKTSRRLEREREAQLKSSGA